ncbi:GAF domain-containing protein [Actinomadura keratinilytica]
MREALARLRRATGLPIAFGGLIEGRHQVRIAELSGTGTTALRGLNVSSGNGLGGKAVALTRPCAVTDYRASRRISHEYDAAVAAEGLRSVLAVPVVVHRHVRGVLYGRCARPPRSATGPCRRRWRPPATSNRPWWPARRRPTCSPGPGSRPAPPRPRPGRRSGRSTASCAPWRAASRTRRCAPNSWPPAPGWPAPDNRGRWRRRGRRSCRPPC